MVRVDVVIVELCELIALIVVLVAHWCGCFFPEISNVSGFQTNVLFQTTLSAQELQRPWISIVDFLGTNPAVLATERICDSRSSSIISETWSHPSQIANPAI